MPTCPHCNGIYSRRVRGGRCPGCNRKVYLFEGNWYRNDLNGIPSDLLELFEKRVAQKLHVPSFKMGADGSAARLRELGRARQLIGDVDDPDLLITAMNIIFEHPKLAWKDRLSLTQISAADWSVALALAGPVVNEQQNRQRVLRDAQDAVMETMKELRL